MICSCHKTGFAVLMMLTIGLITGCSGADSVAKTTYTGDSVADFMSALQSRDTAKARELIATDRTLLELRDEQGQSPLHYAAMHNAADIVELLIDEGIDPNVKDNEGRTPLTALEDAGLRLDAAREALKDNGGTN